MREPEGLTSVEEYSAVTYILLVAGIVFAIDAVPVLLGGFSGPGGLLYLLASWGAWVLIWWTAVRRRQFSVWWTALHLMIAVEVAGLLSALVVLATLDDGHVHLRWTDALQTMLWTALALSPIRFAISAIAVAVGRQLPGSKKHLAQPATAGPSPREEIP